MEQFLGQSLHGNTSGAQTNALVRRAGRSANTLVGARYRCGVGDLAGYTNTTGNNNTYIGCWS